MGDKVRGTIAIVVGLVAILQGGLRYHSGHTGWKTVMEIVAGTVLILLGVWRIRRTPADPAAELMP